MDLFVYDNRFAIHKSRESPKEQIDYKRMILVSLLTRDTDSMIKMPARLK
jgi:hypothetical protein